MITQEELDALPEANASALWRWPYAPNHVYDKLGQAWGVDTTDGVRCKQRLTHWDANTKETLTDQLRWHEQQLANAKDHIKQLDEKELALIEKRASACIRYDEALETVRVLRRLLGSLPPND